METGDIVKYVPTSTVGKILDIKTEGDTVWAKLDKTNLYYKVSTLEPASEDEYKTTSFKERESKKFNGTQDDIDELTEMQRDVNISEMTPSGGG